MELLLLLPYLHICNRVHEGSSTALFISDFALSFDVRGGFPLHTACERSEETSTDC